MPSKHRQLFGRVVILPEDVLELTCLMSGAESMLASHHAKPITPILADS